MHNIFWYNILTHRHTFWNRIKVDSWKDDDDTDDDIEAEITNNIYLGKFQVIFNLS